MPRVLYCVSPIGLGHATRASAVAAILRERGVDVLLASGGNASVFLKSLGLPTVDLIRLPTPSVGGGSMKWASVWYAKYWMGYRRSKTRIGRLMESLHPDLVVGDEEFSCISLALEKGLRHALVTDELELGFARSFIARSIESRVSKWYADLLSKSALVIIPDEGQDSGNIKHVGPIVRKVTKTRDDVLDEFRIPKDGYVVLLSLSGSGIGGHLLGLVRGGIEDCGVAPVSFVVTGNRGRRIEGAGIHDLGVVRDNQNLVAAADVVISNAGKSTIDEAASAGSPIIPIPIRYHAEQERNASSAGYVRGLEVHLGSAIRNKIGRRAPPLTFKGSERTSQLLLSMLG